MCLAVPGRILDLADEDGDALTRSGRVSFGGVVKRVNLAFVPEAVVGDYVIVHVGFAISRLDRAEAERALAELRALDPESYAALGQATTPPNAPA